MAKITIDELSDALKDHLNNLGINEEQLKEIIEGCLELEGLQTENKNLVGAINELFQNANNGKQLIASAIGNPLINVDSTFGAMSEAILGLKRDTDNETDAREVLYNMMVEDGYNEANSEMTVDELIELLDDSVISNVKQISCGQNFTFVLKNDGSLWVCGKNNYGQLGLGNNIDTNTFTKVTTNVKQVGSGANHVFIIKDNGSLWAAGYNIYGELGLGDATNRSTFTQVTTNINNDVKQIICGGNHSFIIKNDGTLWACGNNDAGQLGLNDKTNKNVFTQVTTNINNDIKLMACGYHHVFIVKNDGSLWSTGKNDRGQLGLGDKTDRTTFTQVTTNINNDVKQVTCCCNSGYIVKNDETLWACGSNQYGELGLNDTTDKLTFTQVTTNISDIKQISGKGFFVYILKNNGTLWCCGSNTNGQLGLGDKTSRNVFTQVTTNVNDIKQIYIGIYQIFVLKNNGTVWCCGSNTNGELGLGNTTDKNVFTQVSIPITTTSLSEYDINRLKLYYYLLNNNVEVNESMDIGTMLNLLVNDYIKNMILGYESDLKIILTEKGINVTEEDKMSDLIDKVNNIEVKKYATGSVSNFTMRDSEGGFASRTITINTSFIPSRIILNFGEAYVNSSYIYSAKSCSFNSDISYSEDTCATLYCSNKESGGLAGILILKAYIENINSNSFTLRAFGSGANTIYFRTITWEALG